MKAADLGTTTAPVAALEGLRVCFLRAGALEFDKRTQQMARSLVQQGAQVKVVSLGPIHKTFRAPDGYDVVELCPQQPSAHSSRPLRVAANVIREAAIVQTMVREVRQFDAHVVHCMNVQTLFAGAWAARKRAFVYDSREHFATTGHVSRNVRRWWTWQERRFIPRAAAVITVSELIAIDLAKRYGGPAPVVIYNGCRDRAEKAEPVHMPLRLLHVGRAYADRNVDEMIDAVVALGGRAHLALQAWGEVGDALPRMIADRGAEHVVELIEPVSPDDIVGAIGHYDVGLHNIRPETESYRWTTANKLFEYMAAGLAVVFPDELPETDRIIREADCGVIFPPGEIHDAIARLAQDPAEVERLKERAVAASSAYSWSAQEMKLVDVYAGIKTSGRFAGDK